MPNITGVFQGTATPSGAFVGGSKDWGQCNHAEYKDKVTITFDASKGTVDTSGEYMDPANSPYGKSDTVTPPSVKLLPCMKIYNADTDDFEAYVDREINEHANNINVHFTPDEKTVWTKIASIFQNPTIDDPNVHGEPYDYGWTFVNNMLTGGSLESCWSSNFPADRILATNAYGKIDATQITYHNLDKLDYLQDVHQDVAQWIESKAPLSHVDDSTHITESERDQWNAAKSSIDTHAGKTDIHLTATEKTKVGYLSKVTKDVQDQLDEKEDSGAAASAVSNHNGSTSAHANGFAHALPMNNYKITGLGTPTASADAATKGYVDGLPGVGLRIVSGIYTCTGDQNNKVIYINHGHKDASGQPVAPKMVFACMYGHTSGGDMSMASGTVTMIVFATIPMTNGALSTTQISFLVPDVTTSTSTKIMWTALFDK